MKETRTFQTGGYYLFESLASGRSCYFESEEEISFFKMLIKRYMGAYVEIHKIYLSSEGYQILLRIRGAGVLRKCYEKNCMKKGRVIDKLFLVNPWRIVSERMRIFHSVYVKGVNKMRGRKGVLVQEKYKRYYFVGLEEFKSYILMRESEKEIKAQRKERYRVSLRWKELVDWGKIWGESIVGRVFPDHVVGKWVISTLISHSPPP